MANTGKPPPKQYPFPRDVTKPITGPAYEATDSWQDAKNKWFAFLRVQQGIRQMTIPAKLGHKEKK